MTILAAGVTAVSAAAPAIAAGKRGGSSMPTMATMNGTCERLTISGKDETQGCSGKLLNTIYDDGRTGFYFLASDAAVVTFSGMGANQIKPDADTAIQPVDKVIVTRAGRTSGTRAVGACTFSNPNKGPSLLACQAETGSGRFDAVFRSDGRPPVVSRP